MKTLSNDYTVFRYTPEKAPYVFHGEDKTDKYNRPCCYNETFRGHKRAWDALKAAWDNSMDYEKAIGILRDNKIRIHDFCAMD